MCALWMSTALATPAAAQIRTAETSGLDQEARALFDAASVAFEEGRYENALEYFQRSYALSRRPQLLYNIGVTAERLRLDREALEAFRSFLELAPR